MKSIGWIVLAMLICTVPTWAQNETGNNTTNSSEQINVTNVTDTANVSDTTGTTGDDASTILVMKHLCDARIQTEEDFDRIGDPVSQELACPTVVLNDDEISGSLNGGKMDFDIMVQGETGAFKTLNDATFVPLTACETELSRDLDGDGTTEADVCMDMSLYRFDDMSEGNVTITETRVPEGTRFGVARIGPSDSTAASTTTNGIIELETAGANDIHTVHIFNFRNEEQDDGFFDNVVDTTAGSANLYVKEWYPKNSSYVFVCDVEGFTPTSYSWFYGDGSKLLNIANGDTYHTYTSTGTYEVMCTATNGNSTASDTLSVNVVNLTTARDLTCSIGNSITCDGRVITDTEMGDSCRTLSCERLCVGSFCINDVEDMEVCPSDVQQTARATVADTSGNNLTICHKPGANQQTISVNENAWEAHENHGDYRGICGASNTTNTTNTTVNMTNTTVNTTNATNTTNVSST